MVQCLIDADVLRYECGFASQFVNEDGEEVIREIDFAVSMLEERISTIEWACEADEPSVLYMTDDLYLNSRVNRKRKREGLEPLPFVPNFRYDVAKTKPYKERAGKKPFHYKNLTAHILDHYDVKVIGGIEADDAICMDSFDEGVKIICSRDKDLRQTPGYHYSWECGMQAEWGPHLVDDVGHIEAKKTGLFGYGPKFFYAQMITGDPVDSIPGLPRGGPVLALKLLEGCTTEREMFEAVSGAYAKKLGEGWEVTFEEQAHLLYMIREKDNDGRPKRWSWPIFHSYSEEESESIG